MSRIKMTTSCLQLIYMGNQLLKGYTIQGDPISGVGCQKMWRIYHGLKQNTGTMATIFAIEKKALPKGQRDQLIQFAKREAMSLARIRHPGVLAISEALIQDEQIMAFSTEQIVGNLAMLAKENRLREIVSNEIELRLNLFPLLDTIQFLHQNVKTVHLGINFDNIYITKEGKWKISGFSNSQIHGGDGLEDAKNFRCSNYYFCPPEIVNQKKFEKRSDVYSFGILILDLMLVLTGKYEPKVYRTESDYSQNFESDLLKKLNSEALEKIETYRELKLLLKNVLARDPERRSTLHELSSSKWLNDKLVLTVRYLENITNYDNKQQVEFLKGLLGVLNHFDAKILLRKILPLLLDLLKFKNLIPSVIYICLETMKNGKIITQTDFKQKIWPAFKKVVQGKEMTAHSLYLFVDNMEKIEKIVGLQELSLCVMPLYIKCFDCPTKLKQLALHKTDYILNKMDYQFVKTKMIPKVMNCIKDQNPEIHKKSLIALRKSIKILDTQTITSIVLPGLEACKKLGSDPFINAITVSIYTMLGKTLPSETLCSKLIPTVLPYLSDPNVGPQDFYNYKNALLTMIEKIQAQRKKFWDESQISQGAGFTEKDFEFEDESKKNAVPQSNIGKGDYNFLSNYNNNAQRQEQSQNQTQQAQQRSQPSSPEFNFNSPWGADEPKAQKASEPVLKHTNSLNSPKQSPPSYQQMPIQKQVRVNDGGLGNFGGIGTQGFGKSQLGGLGTSSWNSNQPISPETRQNIPKLKGPQPNKTRKNESQYEAMDPWASIQMHDSTDTTANTWNFPATTPNTNTTGYGMGDFGIKTQPMIHTPTINPVGGSGYGNSGSLFGNLGDPFADIQKGNLSSNTGMGSNLNFGLNTNYLTQTSNPNQFSYGTPQAPSYSLQTNTPVQNNFNSFGYPNTQATNANQFTFDLGPSPTKPAQQSGSGNSFDLI